MKLCRTLLLKPQTDREKNIDNVADNWFTGERITESEKIGSEMPISMKNLVNRSAAIESELESKNAAER